MSYSCILCHADLEITPSETGVLFFCGDCGFKSKGPLGYSIEKAYELIRKNHARKINKSNNPSKIKNHGQSSGTKGFPTRGRTRTSSTSKETSISLENDSIIEDNAIAIKQKISQLQLPIGITSAISEEDQLPVFYEKLPKKAPKAGGDIEKAIKIPALRKALSNRGITKLYAYQEQVHKDILDGSNVIISAPTGLGKTEAFLLPILHIILTNQPDPRKRGGPQAIFIYPTKALAADQLEKIRYYAKSTGIRVEKFDGDTNQSERRLMYNNPPDILLTNADMIHFHLMGNVTFQAMITRVRFIVIDEIHLCVGSYGTNVLWIIKRMKRFNQFIQCIGASATISNAQNFGETMFDAPVKLVTVGTARLSDMHLSIHYPKERSNLSLMANIAENFIRNKNKTLVFGNGHISSETLNLMLQKRGINSEIHRAGLSYTHRRKVENSFKNGTIDAIVSTPTLELGIDIGTVDTVVSMLTGLTSFVQRIGRAGRKGQESFASLILRGDDPISAYYARYPNEYLSDIEPAFVEPNNPYISKMQILAMIFDKPLEIAEYSKFSKQVDQLLEESLIRRERKKFVIHNESAVKKLMNKFSIRGIGESVEIWDGSQKIGDRSLPLAISELHPGGIYLHGGKTYNVTNYNPTLRIAKMQRLRNNREKTQAMRNIRPRIVDIQEENTISGLETAYCELELTEFVHGYLKQDIFTNKVIEKCELEDPISYNYNTMGFLLAMPRPDNFISNLDEQSTREVLMGTYHATEHVLIESGNAYSGGGANQIGGISMADTGTIFVYDGSQGGSGLSRLLYDALDKGLSRSLKVLQDCPCKRRDGCPRCTYSYQCGNNNQPLDRVGAIETLLRVAKDSTELLYNFDGIETFVIDPFTGY